MYLSNEYYGNSYYKIQFHEIFRRCIFLQIASGGICAALFGKWTMKVGTRASMVTGGTIFASAFALTGLGISMHSLPMIYAGNGKLFQTLTTNRFYVFFFHFQSLLVLVTVVRILHPFKPSLNGFPTKEALPPALSLPGSGPEPYFSPL